MSIPTLNLTYLLTGHTSQARIDGDGCNRFFVHGSNILFGIFVNPPDEIWNLPAALSLCLLENPIENTEGLVLTYPLDEVPRDADEIYEGYKRENKGHPFRLWTLSKYRN